VNYDGEKTRTEAPASVEYNFTLMDFDLGCKSIIVMARIPINFRVFPLVQIIRGERQMVDGMGLEPMTPALRTRCSPN
jgi:hypothetical protein